MRDMGGLIEQQHGFGLMHITPHSLGSDMRGLSGFRDSMPAARCDMGGLPARSDPFFNDVVLLIRGDGYHGSMDIVDCSPRRKIVTSRGSMIVSEIVPGIGGVPSGGRPGVALFNGKSIRGASTNSRQCYFSAVLGAEGLMRDDFTIEIWGYSGNNTVLYSPQPRDIGGPVFIPDWNWNANWNFYTVSRQGGWIYEHLNGRLTNVAFSTVALDFGTMYFGTNFSTLTGSWNGNHGEIRVTRNHGRYRYDYFPQVPANMDALGNLRSQLDLVPAPGPNYRGTFRPHVQVQYLPGNLASGGAIAVSFGSGQQPELEDLIVAVVMWEDSAGNSMTTPSGFTLLGDDVQSNCHQSIYWKVADGTETTVTFTLSAGTSHMNAAAIIVRNADPVVGVVGFVQNGDSATAAAITATGQTTVPADSIVIAIGSSHNAPASQVCTPSGTGYVEYRDSSGNTGAGTIRALDVAVHEDASGTIGAATFTWNSNGTRHNAASMQFAPRAFPLFA